jgi:pilus assembly protein CpaF
MTVAAPAVNSFEALRRLVRERLAETSLDREADRDAIRDLIREIVDNYQRDASAGVGGRQLRDPTNMVERLDRSVLGWGPLEQFITVIGGESAPVEVEIRGPDVTWLDHRGRWHTSGEPTSEAELRAVVDRLLADVGRSLTEAHPTISIQVLDRRVRLTASIPPVSDQLEVSLRFYRIRWESLFDLAAWDTLSPAAANWLWALMRHPSTGVLVSGRPMSGKTTLLNALLRAVPASHKVCCCEDTRELHAPLMHISYRQTKPRSGLSDDETETTLRDLVALALRSSPKRIVVGEVRGGEAAELTRAANAGAAVLCSLHSNSARDALDALVNAALLGDHQMPAEFVRANFARSLQVVVHMDAEDVELRGGDDDRPVRRQVMEIVAVSPMQGSSTRFAVIPIFKRPELGAPLQPTGEPLPEQLETWMDQVLRGYGTTTQAVLAGHEVMRQP